MSTRAGTNRTSTNSYVSWEEANAERPLDGLIITGAPVEHLDFEEVRYWPELVKLINEAKDIAQAHSAYVGQVSHGLLGRSQQGCS